MKKLLVVATVFIGLTAHAAEKGGPCLAPALQTVMQQAVVLESLHSKNAERDVAELKLEIISHKIIDAGDTYFDEYQIQVFGRIGKDGNFERFTGRPSQVVYSYDFDKGSPEKSYCALQYFSYAGYSPSK